MSGGLGVALAIFSLRAVLLVEPGISFLFSFRTFGDRPLAGSSYADEN